MLKVNIEAEGHTVGDLELAIEEVLRLIRERSQSGFNWNVTGSFSFERTGEPVEKYAIKRGEELLEDRYDSFYEAEEMALIDDTVVGLSESGAVITLSSNS